MDDIFKSLFGNTEYVADKKLWEELEKLSLDKDPAALPEAPKITITPRGEKVIPVRVAKRMSAYDIGDMRRHMEPDQINERMVSELLQPLLKELDEMGLIDLQINQVTPDTLEYSIKLDVVKHE